MFLFLLILILCGYIIFELQKFKKKITKTNKNNYTLKKKIKNLKYKNHIIENKLYDHLNHLKQLEFQKKQKQLQLEFEEKQKQKLLEFEEKQKELEFSNKLSTCKR